ncbi:MAG: hypothetical protein GWM90_33240, partial [Gemmatimonadetes bacterium]|nr:insulinase family protein [Gemmatimonadota bacterium]NIQ60184.1 insulinase family protein [Gemmatimonadota bacterium]NIU80401.1 hypothetical protein [Gammaproteobacteria bacterium]NIX48744.1 hypothetical protein [Gemmatimonadota bacterium]NIY13202.1 hypothetical protein [Gemmatimonadota bacterium]
MRAGAGGPARAYGWAGAVAATLLAACAGGAPPAAGPESREPAPWERGEPPVGVEVVERLTFPPLRFEPREPERFELSNGVPVFFLRDPALPLVDLFINVKGGYVYFDREHYAAAAALLPLLRNGGTRSLPPDSVDGLIEFHALGMSTSTDGGRMVLGVSALRRQLDLATDLWADLLLHPRFDRDAVERWRERELEAVRRIPDFPGSLAVLEFNRLMYGDHPTGWMMTEADLAPEKLREERLRAI